MKLTDQDLEMFKALKQSGMGKQLADYCDRLTDFVCNSKHWKEGETKESSQRVAKIIEENLVNKIKLQAEMKVVNPNQYD